MEQTIPRKYKWFRVVFMVLEGFITIILAAVIWLQTSSGKNFVRAKAVSYLQGKVGGQITIGTLDYSIPNWIELDNVQIINPQKDTLITGQMLYVNLSIFKLIGGNIDIKEIHLKHINLNIDRKPNNLSFNFQYIIDAFASKKVDTTQKKPTQFTLGKVVLDTVSVGFNDGFKQLFFNTTIGQFSSRIQSMDLGKMNFSITDFILHNSSFVFTDKSTKDAKSVKASVKASASENASPFNLTLQNTDIRKLTVQYKNESSKLNYANVIDTLQLQDAKVHLLEQYFSAKSFTLNNSSFTMATNDPETNVKDTVAKVVNVAIKQGWNVEVGRINLNHNTASIDNNAFDTTKEGLDYNHLKLNNLSLQTSAIHYHNDTIQGNILSGTALANNFLIKNVKGNIVLDNKVGIAKGFQLATQNSSIDAEGSIVFNRTNPSKMLSEASKVNINIKKSYLGYNDFLFFFPSYKRNPPLALKPNQKVLINGKAGGTLREMGIAGFSIETDDKKFQLDAKGKLRNVLDTKQLKYDIVVNKLYVDKTMLSQNMLNQLSQKKINLPANMLVNGRLEGGLSAVKTSLKVNSSYGLANINATASNFKDMKKLQYDVDLTANNLQTGKWIYQDSILGMLNGNIKIKGSGIDYKKDNIQTSTSIKSFGIKGYTYTNVNLNASLNKGAFTAKGNIKDSNIVAAIDLQGTLNNQYPTVKGSVIIDQSNLAKLRLTKDSILLGSTILLDVKSLDPKTLAAIIKMDSSTIIYNGQRLYADSISVKANVENDTTKVFVAAPFAQASLIGKYNYMQLPTTLDAFIQHNYLKPAVDTFKMTTEQAVLSASVMQDSIISILIPALIMDKPAVIRASFDNSRHDTTLAINTNILSVFYNSTEMSNLSLHANGADSALHFVVATDYVVAGGKRFYKAGIKGNLDDNRIDVIASTDDAYKKQFYALGAVIELLKEETKVHLSDSLLLNYGKWNVAKDNFIEIKKDGYVIHDFAMTKDNQSVVINTKAGDTAVSPIVMKIDNFRLSELLSIANQDSTMAGGILDANATIAQPIAGLPAVEGTIGVQSLTYQRVAIGDLSLKTAIGADKIIGVKGSVSGANVLSIDGGYNANNNEFSISTEIQRLNLTTIEAFSQGQLKRTGGSLHGDVFMNGNIYDPRWKGELVFDTAQLATAMFGSLYKINGQKIDFEYPNIGLYDFIITDTLNNKLVIDGTIKHQPDEDFGLNMNVNADNFIAINQPRIPNAMIYGVGIVDASLLIAGTSTTPDVSGNITVDNKSDVHYVMPTKNNYKDDLKQVVKFIKIDTIPSFHNTNSIYTSAKDTAMIIKYNGVTYNLNLEVKDDAQITVLMDESTGDELTIKGKAQLNAGMDENGILGMSGVYQLKTGTYNLSYQVIKKRFDLVDGSTITFSGNPMEAQMDITAQYEIETSPAELLGNEIAAGSGELGSGYSQKIPFEVILKITGTVNKPVISFDIKVRDNADGVNTTLGMSIENKLVQYRADASEMNKQVFALLILGRFIGDRSSDFFAAGGSSTSTNQIAKESVSKFLAEAVNNIAADLIKGVDVNLDLKNYEADATTNTAARTDLNVALSKQLLNDRLTVTVGKSFTVDGSDPVAKTQTNSNVDFLPDLSTTYKLSKDGKYAIRAYRKNQYDAIMDGYFIETGVAFSLTMNYEKFIEVLQKGKTKPKK